MLAFLIVEDDPRHREPIVKQITREYPGAVIHTADNTRQALETLQRAEEVGLRYTVAILDFMLPPDEEHRNNQRVDLETRKAVAKSPATQEAAVFHITAHGRDREIREYIDQERLKNPTAPDPFPIVKEGLWTKTLYEAIRRVVYGARIQRRLNNVLGGQSESFSMTAFKQSEGVGGVSMTQELSALFRDIEKHWPHLSTTLQDQLKKVFPLVPDGKSVRINLH